MPARVTETRPAGCAAQAILPASHHKVRSCDSEHLAVSCLTGHTGIGSHPRQVAESPTEWRTQFGGYFASINRNKRSVVLDLAPPAGRARLRRDRDQLRQPARIRPKARCQDPLAHCQGRPKVHIDGDITVFRAGEVVATLLG